MKHEERYSTKNYFRGSQFFHRPRIIFIVVLIFFSSVVYGQANKIIPAPTTISAINTLTQLVSGQTTLTSVTVSASSSGAGNSSIGSSSTSTSSAPANTSPVSIPKPFDTAQLSGTGLNFSSSSCPQFMRSFLSDSSFLSCVPLSLLIYTSQAFITLPRSGSFAVSEVLDASCNISPSACGAIMDSIATRLVQDANCGQDLKLQNPLVVEALTGLQNYLLYYGAGCLKDNSTGVYCYTLAITNSTNPADAACYYLPTLPFVSGSRPSCTYCTQHLFDIYYTFASNATLGISKTYGPAAQIVDLNCGVDFVNTSPKVESVGERLVSWTPALMSVVIGTALWVHL